MMAGVDAVTKRKLDEKLMMYHHGTLRWSSTPQVLYATARSDLTSYQSGHRIRAARERAKLEGASATHQGKVPKTAFLTVHVNGAGRPSDVLRAALKGIADGQASKRVETLLLYQSEATLRDAIALAERAGA